MRQGPGVKSFCSAEYIASSAADFAVLAAGKVIEDVAVSDAQAVASILTAESASSGSVNSAHLLINSIQTSTTAQGSLAVQTDATAPSRDTQAPDYSQTAA